MMNERIAMLIVGHDWTGALSALLGCYTISNEMLNVHIDFHELWSHEHKFPPENCKYMYGVLE